MDSLTQIVLGAAVGEAVLGRKVGRKAALWGGICGTIPDLDVLSGLFMNELDSLVAHRGFSHSALFAVIFGPLIGWLVYRFVYKQKEASLRGWQWLAFLALITHPMLDCFTNYGTQFFYPFSTYRVAFNSIFIVDLVYTLPFAICLIVALTRPRTSQSRKVWNTVGLVYSTAVLGMSLINHATAELCFKRSLHHLGTSTIRMTTHPMPFNMLWYTIVDAETEYKMGSYSLHEDYNQIQFRNVPKNHQLAEDYPNPETIETLAWFSNGFYSLEKRNDTLFWHDLRFGLMRLDTVGPPRYTFTISLPIKAGADIHQLPPSADFNDPDMKANLSQFWARTWGKGQ